MQSRFNQRRIVTQAQACRHSGLSLSRHLVKKPADACWCHYSVQCRFSVWVRPNPRRSVREREMVRGSGGCVWSFSCWIYVHRVWALILEKGRALQFHQSRQEVICEQAVFELFSNHARLNRSCLFWSWFWFWYSCTELTVTIHNTFKSMPMQQVDLQFQNRTLKYTWRTDTRAAAILQ